MSFSLIRNPKSFTLSPIKLFLIIVFLFSCLGSIKSQNDVFEIVRLTKFADSINDINPTEGKTAAAKALGMALSLHNDSLIYRSRMQLGIANFNLSNFNEALPKFIENLELGKKIADKNIQFFSLNAIANCYKNTGRNKSAISSYKDALKLVNPKNPVGPVLIKSNLIALLRETKQYDSALVYNYDVMKVIQKYKSKDKHLKSNMNGELLFTYMALKKKDSVNKYLNIAIPLKKEEGDVLGLAGFLHNIAGYYMENADAKNAEKYFREALALKHDNLEMVYLSKKQFAELLNETKRYEEAAKLFADCFVLKDSIASIQTMEKLSELEVKYETGKKEEELKKLEMTSEMNTLKLKHNKIWLAISILGILFCVVVAFLLFRQNKHKQKANKVLETQNLEIYQQKKEITDSINYAKRIQTAILPPKKYVDKLLNNYFIFYKPKDIVSGDFYWCEEHDGKIFFAAVDCTGHGVPGALMSVIGFNLLNQAIKEKGFTNCADILSYLDVGVHQTLRQSQEEEVGIKDGMELSVCSLDKKGVLQYAGVYNSVWIVRKNINQTFKVTDERMKFFGEHMLEILPDKMQIGNNESGATDIFTNHKMQLQKGDFVYLYSDGFADQFGGPHGKKFKYKNLKEVLVNISHLGGQEQTKELDKIFTNWKGEHEQIDDILLMGVGV